MDINQEIQLATDKFIEEKLPAMVNEKVSKMIDGVMEDIFRSYGDTAKQIKAKIEQHLDVNLQKFDLIDYNHLISKAINDKLVAMVNENSVAPILELTKSALGFVNQKEIKLSAIHQMVIDAAIEDDGGYESSGKISFHVEEDEKHKWHKVAFDIDEKKDIKNCEIDFLVNESGTIFCFRAGNFMQQKAAVTPARLTMLSRLEHQVFRLYSANVKIIIDEVYFDNEWPQYD